MTLLPLQQLPNLQDQDRAIDGENVVHQCHCQQTHLKTEKTSKNSSLPEGQICDWFVPIRIVKLSV